MTLEQKAALRSLLRSLLFNVAPLVLGFVADAAWLTKMGVPAGYAPLVAEVVGILARTFAPDVFGPRPQVVVVAPKS